MILQPQYGLACPGEDCKCNSLGAVSDFASIKLGGKLYSVSELYAKAPTLFAQVDTKVYSSAFDASEVKYITKAGNPLGKYSSFLQPRAGRSQAWVELQTGTNRYVYIPNEVVGSNAIANQGVKTVQDQLKDEAAAKEKENDPYTYYFKKLVVSVLLVGGGIYVAVQLGKTFIQKKVK
jgi:hypothetical protein